MLSDVRLLQDAEIAARLRRHTMPRRSRGERVPLTCVAFQARLSRPTIYKYMRGGRVTEKYRPVLSIVLWSLEQGTLRFTRRQQRWEAVRRLPPSIPPPPAAKMTRAEEWQEWASCRACAGRAFSLVFSAARALMVCDSCVPPSQYPGLGLSAVQE